MDQFSDYNFTEFYVNSQIATYHSKVQIQQDVLLYESRLPQVSQLIIAV